MIASTIVLLVALIATAYGASFHECFPGNYCGPLSGLVTQTGTFATPALCATQCQVVTPNKFFSYVPSSQQCLCAAACATQVANPNVNSYSLTDTFTLCYTNKQCGQNTDVVTQPSTYATTQNCADQCAAANVNFEFFNYVATSKQCQCILGCSTTVASTGTNAYVLNGACPAGNLRM